MPNPEMSGAATLVDAANVGENCAALPEIRPVVRVDEMLIVGVISAAVPGTNGALTLALAVMVGAVCAALVDT